MKRPGRPGLRSSVTAAFAVGALLLSAALSLGTFLSARHSLVDQRERTALRQAFVDAALVRDGLSTSGTAVDEALSSVAPPAGASMYVRRGTDWYSSSLDRSGEELTAQVSSVVARGSVGVAWTSLTRPNALVVGIPLPAVDAEYYEVAVAKELDATLRTLSIALVVGAALTTLAGVAVGRAVSTRVLAPLSHVAEAAFSVSEGDLRTRLPDTSDPDLALLVGAFNHMVDALHTRIERDARFAADVSHELRTPLTTLTTSLTLLQRAEGLDAQGGRAVQLMADELTRFHRALEDLLTLGRLDAGIDEAQLRPTGARELARQALVVSGRPVTHLQAHHGTVDPSVLVDRPRMVRALINLYDNADLHGQGLVAVVVTEHHGHVELHVHDRGPGVAAEDRLRVFERFARSRGAKAGTGSGLGLSIVAQTVDQHGGRVWCTHTEDGGSDFVIRLPRSGEKASPR